MCSMYGSVIYSNIIRNYHECEGGNATSIPRITVWHHEACQIMTKGYHEENGFVKPIHTQILDSFSLSPLNSTSYV